MEHTIGIRELKTKISQVIKAARDGESVTITWHGKPLARIVPYEPVSGSETELLLNSASIEWDGKPIREINPVGYNTSGKQLSDLVTDLRE